ncbi:hypothetical protein CK203_056372 [Vitis vinifera]|uniref:Reverse transcriptase zinc-binding domain-containing protein n=1 Tax=Vitis vinifera TaxID=29760 RepID=A0A438GL20_VITVI|nr:hypothetical protein CK203_056372 [Vitis vinifera]
MVGDLLHVLRGHRPSLEEDSVIWRRGRYGQFRVKEAYSLLTNPNDTGFPSRCIWVARVLTKVAFFSWEATWGKVFTLDRLQRRGVQLPNCCFLCGCEEENVNHILIHFSRVINSEKPSGDRVSFRSPSPSPNTFRSVGSSSENTHSRQTFPANFPATSFSDTDHTRRSAWRRSPTFVKAPEPKDHPRVDHAQFSVRRLHLTRRQREDFPGHAASSSSLT